MSARLERLPLPALVALWLLASLMLGAFAARAEEPHLHAGVPADADWYPGMKQPGSTTSCCGASDCRLSSYCSAETIGEGIAAPDGTCIPMPYDRLVPPPVGVTLQPGEVHACMRPYTVNDEKRWSVLCVVGGGEV